MPDRYVDAFCGRAPKSVLISKPRSLGRYTRKQRLESSDSEVS